MNDPGLDEPVAQVADHQEANPYEKQEKLEKEEEEDFLDPRYAYSRSLISSANKSQSLVVCVYSMPAHRWHNGPNCEWLQYLRSRGLLARVHTRGRH